MSSDTKHVQVELEYIRVHILAVRRRELTLSAASEDSERNSEERQREKSSLECVNVRGDAGEVAV